MAGTMTRAKMNKKYKSEFEHIPENKSDIIDHLKEVYNLSDINIKNVNAKISLLKKRKMKKITYTLFELPLTTDRARGNWSTRRFYVNNAKKNKEFILKKLKELNIDTCISTEIHMRVKLYFPTPKSMSKEDKLLAEYEYLAMMSRPDLDNIYKTYTDMLNEVMFVDDSVITKTNISKYYSIKPRVEMELSYYDDFDTNYNKRKIEATLGFKRLMNIKKERKPKCLKIAIY